MGKLINRIPGSRLLISSLQAMSTSVLKALPGKLDIKRHSPSILYVLDLILTSTLVSKVECLPGLSDHDIVLVDVATKPAQIKQKRRKIHLYNKADWITFRSKLSDYQTQFLSEHHGKSVEQLWSDFTDKLDQLTDQCIPTKVIKGIPSLPWISRETDT